MDDDRAEEMRIYFAGRITGSRWRQEILGKELPTIVGTEYGDRQVTVAHGRAIALLPPPALYVGPFPMSAWDRDSKHGSVDYGHGIDGAWNYGSTEELHVSQKELGHATPWQYAREAAHTFACEGIETATHVFAYIDSEEAHGTLVELGMAQSRALGDGRAPYVEVAFVSKELQDKMWFAAACAFNQYNLGGRHSPRLAWRISSTRESLLSNLWLHQISEKVKQCESPIEAKLYRMLLEGWPDLAVDIVPQYVEGPYRLDFAVPARRVGIECDGHEWHASREQRTNDAARDRYFAERGWTIIRCTGSEIHRNVFDLAQSVINITFRTQRAIIA